MGSRESQIEALLIRARRDLAKLRTDYEACLRAQSVSDELKIDVKGLCEDLRSTLEYSVCEMRDKFNPPNKANLRVYFPIAESLPDFEGRMAKWFPSLRIDCPDLWSYLESVQPYRDTANRWLALFNRPNNTSKHDSLMEQTRIEQREVRVTSAGGGGVSYDPSRVRFSGGVAILGVPVDPRTQRPVPHPSVKVEEIVWVDFQYDLDGDRVSALGLLEQSMQGVETIVKDIRTRL